MRKKAQTALFMLAATVFNIVLTIICLAVLLALYLAFVVPHIPENAGFTGFPVIFLASLIFSFLIYRKALGLYLKKYHVNSNQ